MYMYIRQPEDGCLWSYIFPFSLNSDCNMALFALRLKFVRFWGSMLVPWHIIFYWRHVQIWPMIVYIWSNITKGRYSTPIKIISSADRVVLLISAIKMAVTQKVIATRLLFLICHNYVLMSIYGLSNKYRSALDHTDSLRKFLKVQLDLNVLHFIIRSFVFPLFQEYFSITFVFNLIKFKHLDLWKYQLCTPTNVGNIREKLS